jgi:hypothetical protein
MDTPRLTTGYVIAGLGGVAVLMSLFLPWYGVSVDIAGVSLSETGSGWEVLGFIDMLLLLISIGAIAIVAARAAGLLPDDVPAPVLLLALGALAVLLVLYRIFDIPTDGPVPAEVDLSRKLGIFVALAGAAAVAYGGWRAQSATAARGKGRRRRLELRESASRTSRRAWR